MTFRYIPNCATIAEAEAWCEAHGYRLVAVERGPDGLLRGVAVRE